MFRALFWFVFVCDCVLCCNFRFPKGGYLLSSHLQEVPTNLEASDFGPRIMVPVFGAVPSDVLALLTKRGNVTNPEFAAKQQRLREMMALERQRERDREAERHRDAERGTQTQSQTQTQTQSDGLAIPSPNFVPHAPSNDNGNVQTTNTNANTDKQRGTGRDRETDEDTDTPPLVDPDAPGRILVFGDSNCLDMNHR